MLAEDSAPANDRTLYDWLAHRLEQERRATLHQLLRQHEILLNDFFTSATQGSTSTSAAPVCSDAFQSDWNAMINSSRQEREIDLDNFQDLSISKDEAFETTTTYEANESVHSGHARVSAFPVDPVASGTKRPSVRTMLRKQKGEIAYGDMTWIQRVVRHAAFETFTCMLIIACIFIMVLENQWIGLNRGHSLGFLGETESGTYIFPSGGKVLTHVHWCFSISFGAEFVLRFIEAVQSRERCFSRKVCWIGLDGGLVLLNSICYFDVVSFSIHPNLLRMLRLLRILRLVRLLEDYSAFHSLFILVRSLQVSMGALVWSFIVLICLQVLFGLVLSNALASFMDDLTKPEEKRREVYMHFGTFSRSLVTMFEISLANWVPTCRLLMDHVAERYSIFYLLYRCMFLFAVIRVISAVFIAETNRMMAADDDLETQKKLKTKRKYTKKLRELFEIIHGDDKDYFKIEDFESRLSDETIRAWLSTMDIDATDLKAMFEIIDDIDPDNGDGIVQMKDFISGLMLIKGPARSLDVLYLRKQMNLVLERCDEIAEAQLRLPSSMPKVTPSQTGERSLLDSTSV